MLLGLQSTFFVQLFAVNFQIGNEFMFLSLNGSSSTSTLSLFCIPISFLLISKPQFVGDVSWLVPFRFIVSQMHSIIIQVIFCDSETLVD